MPEDVAISSFISVNKKQAGSGVLHTKYSLLSSLAASLNSFWSLTFLFRSNHLPTLIVFQDFFCVVVHLTMKFGLQSTVEVYMSKSQKMFCCKKTMLIFKLILWGSGHKVIMFLCLRGKILNWLVYILEIFLSRSISCMKYIARHMASEPFMNHLI